VVQVMMVMLFVDHGRLAEFPAKMNIHMHRHFHISDARP